MQVKKLDEFCLITVIHRSGAGNGAKKRQIYSISCFFCALPAKCSGQAGTLEERFF